MRARIWAVLIGVAALTVSLAAYQAPGSTSQDEEFLKGAYVSSTPGLVLPKATKPVTPKYTREAMQAKLQGSVEVQVIVGTDGKVDRVRVTRSLDKATGLDNEAIAAAKQWMFVPGQLKGEKVPVAVTLVLEFRLH